MSFIFFLFAERRWNYDNVLSRLTVHKYDSWRGIAPYTVGDSVHINALDCQSPAILAAKFANCNNHRNIIAIANEDGKVLSSLTF